MDEPTDLTPRVRSLLASAAYEVKTVVAARPAIALRAERRRRPGHVVDDATEIVIDSYPRCASSFAVAAFRLAQEPRAVAIAHHTHMPAQVLEGARRGLPTLVLIREPVPVVVSHLVYRPWLAPISAVRGFVRFYAPLETVLDAVVVATFEQVVGDYGSVIERVNERFATTFVPFRHTPENLTRIEGEIDADYRRRTPHDELERRVSRPSGDRRDLADAARERVEALRGTEPWRRAESLYRRFASAAGD